MGLLSADNAPIPLTLIFNPISGAVGESPVQLLDVIAELQALRFLPEVHLVDPEQDLSIAVRDALRRGSRLFVVCGGDGTIDSVAAVLAGKRATLGIIPTGTQNNVALSLGIPSDIPSAVGLLRRGRRVKLDMGYITCCNSTRPFLEGCSVGLLSALFPAADDIQHGKIARIGDLLSTLVSSPPAEIQLAFDSKGQVHTQGHVALVSNMPYLGPHYQVSPDALVDDGLLDVLIFGNLSKLELLGNAVQMVAGGKSDDPRILRYKVRRIDVKTDPPMPVLADGITLGESPISIHVQPRILSVLAGLIPQIS